MLNTQWLLTFKTLIEVGHFTKTAETLFMTQPGVTQHIQKLEQACGHALIRRFNKQFEITEQGRLVYEYAKTLEQDQKDLFEQLSFDDDSQGECKISCSGSTALALYPKIIELQKKLPKLSTSLEVAPNHKILADILGGKIDLGLVTQKPVTEDLDYQKAGIEELCLVAPKNALFSSTALQALGLIDHPDAEHYLSLYLKSCGDETLEELLSAKLTVRSYINQLSQILLPVANGLGFTVLPKTAIDQSPFKNQLSIHSAPNACYETLYLVHKRYRDLPARYQNLINHCFDDTLSL